jgi:PAS domain S-box-containing protein
MERKRMEETLRDSEEKYRTLFENSKDAIYITTQEGQFVGFNNSTLDLFGYTKDEMMRLTVKNLFLHPRHRLKFQREIERKESVRDYAVRFRKKDGTKIYCLLTSNPQLSKDGKILGYRGIMRDITESKRWEEDLSNSREQLRALAARLQSVREEERTQIARQIHDELGQQLTGLKMDLSWLSKKLPKTHKSLGNKTESMMMLIDETIQSVRRISTELRPGILDDLGLMAALEWQAKDFQDRSGIKCEFKSNLEEIDLDRNLSTAVFRIFQETLNNVIRHAKATRIKTTLVKQNKKLELKVEDNGKGIAKNKIFDSKSLGLVGMRERILPWEGQIEISGIRGKGTTVRVIIPMK